MRDVVIGIPARMQSSRFPLKPLAMKDGLPLVLHVVKRALYVTDRVIVCTDSHEIAEACRGECEVYLATCDDAWCGTERIGHAARALPKFFAVPAIVNWQVDEPCVRPDDVLKAIERLKTYGIATLAGPLAGADFCNEDVVKVLIEKDGTAINFCRLRQVGTEPLHHIGIYVFGDREFFAASNVAPSPNALRLRLEQLAWMSKIGVVRLDEAPLAINTREDYEKWVAMP